MASLSNVLEEGKVGQQLGKSLRPNRVIFSFLSDKLSTGIRPQMYHLISIACHQITLGIVVAHIYRYIYKNVSSFDIVMKLMMYPVNNCRVASVY